MDSDFKLYLYVLAAFFAVAGLSILAENIFWPKKADCRVYNIFTRDGGA